MITYTALDSYSNTPDLPHPFHLLLLLLRLLLLSLDALFLFTLQSRLFFDPALLLLFLSLLLFFTLYIRLLDDNYGFASLVRSESCLNLTVTLSSKMCSR